jgi:eukaryotic-like serine/threonine-protein kinase
MGLASGTRFGPYEIVIQVGAGGMGEVYRAKDTRLNRTVAIKILPPHLSSSPDLRQRFEREARAVSSLSHAHICTLHDIGNQDGAFYLVMEFLEGENLADRLSKGPLPLEQTLRYGMQIADALEKAHKQGIVHRDLKPGNIMLTKSGAKLLDFGLAKFAAEQTQPALSEVATEGNLTAEGTILGTIQYMAPEQLEGSDADARTDIFAFGAVLYEMATGRKAFTGKSRASLITAIMSAEPQSVSTIQPMTPRSFDRLVKICLAKDPDARWQTAHDVMLELQGISESISQHEALPVLSPRPKKRQWAAWLVAGICALGMTTFAVAYWMRGKSDHQNGVIQLSVVPPNENGFFSGSGPVVVSPDGNYIAFSNNYDGKRTLWVRPLNEPEAHLLVGTEYAIQPFWSPDSRSLAFFSAGRLMRTDISGGRPQVVCQVQSNRGGSWGTSGVIIFGDKSTIYQVPESGGTPKPVTRLNQSLGEVSQRFPFFLPDGRRFLFLSRITTKNQAIYAGSLDSNKTEFVMTSGSKAVYAPPGYLLSVKDGLIMAQAVDPRSLKLKGESFPISEMAKLVISGTTGQVAISASNNGVLAYWSGNVADVRLTWFNRKGQELGTLGETWTAVESRSLRISPDGTQVAWLRPDPDLLTSDIWVTDIARNISSRLTSDPRNDEGTLWSPDGKNIAFNRDITLGDAGGIFLVPSSGVGAEQFMFKGGYFLTDWTLDGKLILAYKLGKRNDLWILPTFGDRNPYPFLQTEFDEFQGTFSPDGRWIAYTSNESGNYEVYVQPFPASGKKWRISTSGGGQPRWRRDGKELFYLSLDRKLVAVEVKENAAQFEAGSSQTLFNAPISSPYFPFAMDYDISLDGQRFLVSASVEQYQPPISVILNWPKLVQPKP